MNLLGCVVALIGLLLLAKLGYWVTGWQPDGPRFHWSQSPPLRWMARVLGKIDPRR